MHPEENTLNSINEIVYKPVKIDLKEEFIMTNNRKILTKRVNRF